MHGPDVQIIVMNQIIRDYPWLLTVIEWLKLVLTILLMPVAVYSVYVILKYIRFCAVRINRIHAIKSICRKNKASIRISETFRSIWKNDGKFEISISSGVRQYNIKLIGCRNQKASYYLDGLDCIIESWKRPPLSFLVSSGGKRREFMTSFISRGTPTIKMAKLKTEIGDVNRFHNLNISFPEADEKTINIICFLPSAYEIIGVFGSQTMTLGNGDIYEECHIFSGKGITEYLEAELQHEK